MKRKIYEEKNNIYIYIASPFITVIRRTGESLDGCDVRTPLWRTKIPLNKTVYLFSPGRKQAILLFAVRDKLTTI